MPVTGVSQVQANYRKVFKGIRDKKAPQFIAAVQSIGESHSKELAPLAYGTLVNSTIKDIDVVGTKVIGTFSYNTLYAVMLENNPNWKPKPPPKYGNKKRGEAPAPAWNPNAVPHFLRRGFEGPESQALIKRAERIFRL